MKNKTVQISSSLEGRDLSILKSILNIKNQYDNLIFKYTPLNKASEISIDTSYEGSKLKYFAIYKKDNTVFPIEPSFNPQSLRELFTRLSKCDDLQIKNKNILYLIYKFMRTESNLIMNIKSSRCKNCITQPKEDMCYKCQFFNISFDKNENKIYSNKNIGNNLITKISQSCLSDIVVSYNEGVKKNHLEYTMSMLDFNWKMGFKFSEEIFEPKLKSENYSFKQVAWPDYGQLPFYKEFIQISSIMNNNSITYKNLNEQTSFSKDIINQFINAAYLSNRIILITNHSRNHSIKTNTTEFIKKLKSFFLKTVKTNEDS